MVTVSLLFVFGKLVLICSWCLPIRMLESSLFVLDHALHWRRETAVVDKSEVALDFDVDECGFYNSQSEPTLLQIDLDLVAADGLKSVMGEPKARRQCLRVVEMDLSKQLAAVASLDVLRRHVRADVAQQLEPVVEVENPRLGDTDVDVSDVEVADLVLSLCSHCVSARKLLFVQTAKLTQTTLKFTKSKTQKVNRSFSGTNSNSVVVYFDVEWDFSTVAISIFSYFIDLVIYIYFYFFTNFFILLWKNNKHYLGMIKKKDPLENLNLILSIRIKLRRIRRRIQIRSAVKIQKVQKVWRGRQTRIKSYLEAFNISEESW